MEILRNKTWNRILGTLSTALFFENLKILNFLGIINT